MRLNRTGLVLVLVVVALITRFGLSYAQDVLAPYTLVAENEYLGLYVNNDTTEIAVKHLESNEIWFSNPPDSRTDKDTLSIIYYNPSDEMQRMNNYADSIEYGQYEIEEIENGIRITYLFGQEWWEDDWLPLMVPQDRFENDILPYVPERDQSWFAGNFMLIGLEETDDDYERISITALPNKDQQFGDYTVVSPGEDLSDKDKQTLILLLVDTVVAANPSELVERADLRLEHIDQLIETPAYVIDNTIRPWDRSDIIAIMQEINYSPDRIAEDHIANKIEPPKLNVEVFTIPMEYVLDEDSLIVRVPMDGVEYPYQVEPNDRYITGVASYFRPTNRTEVFEHFGQIGGTLVDFPLYSINVLNHFGASPTGSQGYLFIPDGSGALVHTEIATNVQYARNMYGMDHSVQYALEDDLYFDPMDRYLREDLYMPVFGLKEDDKAIFAIIEDGHGMARIKANTSSSISPYSRVSSEYVLLPYGEINLTETDRTEELSRRATGQIKSFPVELPDEDIVIRYSFLVGPEADYAGMANRYREYLVEEYNLQKVGQVSDDIPFYVEFTGAVPVQKSIMGIPKDVITSLTSYSQVSEIVEELVSNRISNIQVKYNGWMRGGMLPGFPNKVRLEGVLGTKADFNNMASFLVDNEVGFYPNVNFLTAYYSKYGRFNLRRDIAQSLNRQPVWMVRDNIASEYVIAPARLLDIIDNFLDDYLPLNISGLALGDLGKIINSDFSADKPTSRADSLVINTEGMDKLKTDFQLDLLIDRSNIYAVPYAKHIINTPLTSNNYNIISESVPFYQMVVHGYVNYAGRPLNHYPDYNVAVLKSIETGASPYFSWMFEPGTAVKQTEFDVLFANHYGDWLERANSTYHEMNSVLSQVKDQCIINHQELDYRVYKTTYENGLAIIVNYNNEPYEYNGYVIKGESYQLIGEGDVNEAY